MTDLETIELAAYRVSAYYGQQGSHGADLLYEAFKKFAEEIQSARYPGEVEE